MADKRPVDELSIEELERILIIKKREARQKQLQRMKRSGRVIETGDTTPPAAPIYENETIYQDEAASDANGLPAATISAPTNSVKKRKNPPQFEDGVDPDLYTKPHPDAHRIWRMFLDRTLLFIEGAAVIGLLVVGAIMLDGISSLQQETAQAQRRADAEIRASIPTLAPTPQLRLADIVLPGGHTPPTEVGGGQFNFDEIPVNLRAQMRNQVFLPPDIQRPAPSPQTPLRLLIPDINVDQVIVQGVDWEALKLGVGQLPNGVTPTDEQGNVVLAAHNDIYGEIFRHLDQLEPGMQFQIQTETQIFTYTITGTDIVEPDAVHVMQSQGHPTATLISCYPYQVNDKRIVVFADLVMT